MTEEPESHSSAPATANADPIALRKTVEAGIILDSWGQHDLRQGLLENPAKALSDGGFKLASDATVLSCAESVKTLRIVIPNKPAASSSGDELSDESLEGVVGGEPITIGIVVGIGLAAVLAAGTAGAVGAFAGWGIPTMIRTAQIRAEK